MSESRASSRDSSDSVDENDPFDQAVAQCIRRLESGLQVDADWLEATYPDWHEELADFVADWDTLEGYSSELRNFPKVESENTFAPKTFGEFELLKPIGSGGMGAVFKANQASLSRVVAIKMLHNVRHDRKRFQMEAESVAKLDHSNIVSIYEVGEQDGVPYFTMPFIDGSDLDALVAGHEEFTPDRAATIAEKIASAVHYAHQRGILHRDLKPANILIDSIGEPHVTDFGLAKHLESSDQLTRTNAIIGTPSYMAPEQALGKNADVSVTTDIYGVGTILYAMLTGRAPFSGNSSMDVLRQVIESNPRGLNGSSVTHDLKVICEKCLAKNQSDRYQSALELSQDLQRYLSGEPIRARPLGRIESLVRWAKRKPTIAALTTATCALLLFGIVSLALLLRSESQSRKAAEQGRLREQSLNAEINSRLQNENLARERAERTLYESYINYGCRAQEQDRPAEAFLWFCKAGQLSGQTDASTANRIATWMNRIPRPIFAHHDQKVRLASFDASDRWLLCFSENQAHYSAFDLKSGRRVELNRDHSIECLAWGREPGVLWLGTTEGNVLRLDCQSDQTATDCQR